mgnify:CR=1 FL=1
MIKKTLCFSNPIYLSLRNAQLVLHLPEVESNKTLPEAIKKEAERTIPIEDIGVVILDNRRITITSGVMEALLENNCAVITCNQKSMPVGLLLPLCGNTTQNERFRSQLEASLPLRKQLWQQTIKQKILNQEFVLRTNTDKETNCMRVWSNDVRSGDPDNLEARAAAYYWKNVFTNYPNFVRDREGTPPNNILNYGYAILLSAFNREITAAGYSTTMGVNHCNEYNPFNLTCDLMEPFRPVVDREVYKCRSFAFDDFFKSRLIDILNHKVIILGKEQFLSNAINIYVKLFFRAMEEGSEKDLPEYELI